MLPDYPSLKGRMMKERTAAFQRDVDGKMPIVSRIKSVRIHEGHSFSNERTDGVIDVQEFLHIEGPIAVSAGLEFDQTVEEVRKKIEDLAGDVAAHMEQVFAANFERVTSEVGNAFDMKGAPFTLESYIDMLDHVDVAFDNFGFPVWPTPMGRPEMIEAMSREFVRLKTSSVLRDRVEALVQKKREEWRARESGRRLVN